MLRKLPVREREPVQVLLPVRELLPVPAREPVQVLPPARELLPVPEREPVLLLWEPEPVLPPVLLRWFLPQQLHCIRFHLQ